jgi:hypothetical protein
MKKSVRILAILALLGSSNLVVQNASAWSPSANIAVSVFGGTNREEPRSIKIDQNGNIYSTGYFSGTADFDPGEGVANLTSLGSIDIFVSKLDPSGNYLWAKRFGGELGDCGNSIGFDSSGNVYSTGGFRGSVDFDPGAGTANLGSGSDYGIYVLKLDPSGNYLWAKSVGSALSNDSRGITVDSNGNSVISGMYTGTVDFNPGGGSADLTSNGSNDIFLLKLDSFGNFSWAKSIGSSTSDESYAITGDDSGNIYTTGPFSGVVDFDPGDGVANLTSAGSFDIFVSKLDASGNYVWAKRMGGTSSESGDAIEVDSSGNVYTTGEFSGTADFDPGTGTANLTSVGQRDAFFSKLDASGNYVWAKNIGESLPAWGQSITVDRNGDVYATGGFQGTVDFDSGAGTANLTSNGDYDVYILKLDSSGNYVWVKRFGGLGNDTGFFLTNDYSGNIYTTGFFNGTVDFEPGTRTSEFTSQGSADIFISKLDPNGGVSYWNNKSTSSNIAASVFGGEGGEQGISIAVDSSGNIYSTGVFTGTADFDPSDGVSNLTSAGENDIFISKLDPSGNLLWAKRFGDTTGDTGKSIAIDSSGNVLVTGDFTGTIDFDPGTGVANRTSNGGYDFFVLKLDPSGNFLWAKNVGGEGAESGIFIAVDRDGNACVTGIFSRVVDFDPGTGVLNLTSSGGLDIFVTKFDSAGNHLWSNGRGGSTNDIGDGIGVDSSGNVYSSGVFSGTVDLDPSEGVFNVTSSGANDMFISKFGPSGNFLWAKKFGGVFGDGPAPIFVDSSGNIYISGDFFQTVDFYPGEGVFNLTAAGAKDNFISKLDSSGNHIWTKRIGSAGAIAFGARTSVDNIGNIYYTGTFAGTVDFDPGDGITNLSSSRFSLSGGSDDDIFISKLDSSGNFLWAKRIGSTGEDRGQAIAVDINGNVYSTGYFNGNVDFDPGVGTANLLSAGGKDIFVSKLDSSGNAPLVAVVSAGSTPNSKVATIPSGVTVAAIAKTDELPAIKLNFGGGVPASVTVVPITTNPASQSATPFTISPSTKIVDIQVDSSFSGSTTICLDGDSVDRLYHFTNQAWVELSSQSYVNGQVCGVTTSFSPFAAAPPSPVAAPVTPMLPTDKPIVTISGSSIMCTMGSHSAAPTSSVFSLFVDGEHISTNFSAVGDYLPNWIIPWASSSSISRTASLTSATWAMSDAYKGKAVSCTTLAYSQHATGMTSSEKMMVK